MLHSRSITGVHSTPSFTVFGCLITSLNDANQCLHNKSGSHGVADTNLSNFTCLLVDFGNMLCSSANELQQNSNASSREEYIPQILTVLLEILRVYI